VKIKGREEEEKEIKGRDKRGKEEAGGRRREMSSLSLQFLNPPLV